jgi:hypothetical protein
MRQHIASTLVVEAGEFLAKSTNHYRTLCWSCWAEAPIKIARMTLTIKLDGNWSSFQLANNTPPLSVTGGVIAPSARMLRLRHCAGTAALAPSPVEVLAGFMIL